jgi:mycofactocin precursor
MDTTKGTGIVDATEATTPTIRADEGNDTAVVDIEETLIEEISIDGMCGVY